MKEIGYSLNRIALIFGILVMYVLKINGQVTMPAELNKNTLKEQLNYIEERTRIYENYRAIREDMFQKILVNVSDTLSNAKSKINGLDNQVSALRHVVDSLNMTLEATKIRLEDMTRTKNSISVLGLEVNKIAYNSIMWIIVAGLLTILLIGFLVFKRNLAVTINTKKELTEFKNEFETFRKTSQQARDKMSMDHFNELKKLRGK